MFKFHYIYEFVMLAQSLNFSKTAEACYITQPALSRHIAILEEDFGIKLLNRTTRSVELTPAGELVRDSFQQILQIYMSTKSTTDYLSKGKTGTLTISIPYYWYEDFAEPIIQLFQNDNPQCYIKIVSCQPEEGIEHILNEKSDITISSFLPNAPNEIRYSRYARESLAVACLQTQELAQNKSLSLSDLSGYPLLTMHTKGKELNDYGQFIIQLLAERGIHPETTHYMQQIDTMGLDIQKTNAICIVPYGVRHMDRSYLKFIPLTDQDCYLNICLYYRMDNNNILIPKFVETAHRAF